MGRVPLLEHLWRLDVRTRRAQLQLQSTTVLHVPLIRTLKSRLLRCNNNSPFFVPQGPGKDASCHQWLGSIALVTRTPAAGRHKAFGKSAVSGQSETMVPGREAQPLAE